MVLLLQFTVMPQLQRLQIPLSRFHVWLDEYEDTQFIDLVICRSRGTGVLKRTDTGVLALPVVHGCAR